MDSRARPTIKVTSRSALGREDAAVGLRYAPRGWRGDRRRAPGENARKALVARFPARQTKFEYVELDGKSPTTQRFTFVADPGWNRKGPAARRVRAGQAHRPGPSGDRPPLGSRPRDPPQTSATVDGRDGMARVR